MSIKYILNYLFATGNTQQPVRLQKQASKKPVMELINGFVEQNFYFIVLATITILLACFVIFCFMIVGLSATESGAVYNHLQGVI